MNGRSDFKSGCLVIKTQDYIFMFIKILKTFQVILYSMTDNPTYKVNYILEA